VCLLGLQDALRDLPDLIGPHAPREVSVPPRGRGLVLALNRLARELPQAYPDTALHEGHRLGVVPHRFIFDLLGAALREKPKAGEAVFADLLAAKLFELIAHTVASKVKVTSSGDEVDLVSLLKHLGPHAEVISKDTLSASQPSAATLSAYVVAGTRAADEHWQDARDWVRLVAERHPDDSTNPEPLLLDSFDYVLSRNLHDQPGARAALSRFEQKCPGLGPEVDVARAALEEEPTNAHADLDQAMKAVLARGLDSPEVDVTLKYQTGGFFANFVVGTRRYGLTDRRGSIWQFAPGFRSIEDEIAHVEWSFTRPASPVDAGPVPFMADVLALKAWIAMNHGDDLTASRALSDILGLYHGMDLSLLGGAGMAPVSYPPLPHLFDDPRVPLWLATVAELRGLRTIAEGLFTNALDPEAWSEKRTDDFRRISTGIDGRCAWPRELPDDAPRALSFLRCTAPSLFESFGPQPKLTRLVFLRTVRALAVRAQLRPGPAQAPDEQGKLPEGLIDELKSYDKTVKETAAAMPQLLPSWAPALYQSLESNGRLPLPTVDVPAIHYANHVVDREFACEAAYQARPSDLQMGLQLASLCDRQDAAREILQESLNLKLSAADATDLVKRVIAVRSYFSRRVGPLQFWAESRELGLRLLRAFLAVAPDSVAEQARHIADLGWPPAMALKFRVIALASELALDQLPGATALDLLREVVRDAPEDEAERRFLKVLVFDDKKASERSAFAHAYLIQQQVEEHGDRQKE
jgi:hypothetical protein